MNAPRFVLASASPARRQLLHSVGIAPVVQPSDYDESQAQQLEAEELVEFLALGKAKTVVRQLQEPALVLGCDSVLQLDGQIYGKPEGAAVAVARWQQMRGRVGRLYTGHALFNLAQQAQVCCQVTEVYFADISDSQIEAYVSTQEPLHCAGSFALDGYGGLFIDKIVGCHSNVIGLSLPLLRQMLAEFGYDVTDFWHR
ncbi:Maf family protein [Acaryochloris thomasi]|nr:nucleoside triphosphate pyrophosphatase [Acaryochloris thomasi]